MSRDRVGFSILRALIFNNQLLKRLLENISLNKSNAHLNILDFIHSEAEMHNAYKYQVTQGYIQKDNHLLRSKVSLKDIPDIAYACIQDKIVKTKASFFIDISYYETWHNLHASCDLGFLWQVYLVHSGNQFIKNPPNIFLSLKLEEVYSSQFKADLHLHLNGSESKRDVWLNAISNPLKFVDLLRKESSKANILEVNGHSVGGDLVKKYLLIANIILDYFSATYYKDKKRSHHEGVREGIRRILISSFPYNGRKKTFISLEESELVYLVLKSKNQYDFELLYIYQLLKTNFYRFVSQSIDSYGFYFFEAVTNIGFKESSTIKYKERIRKNLKTSDFVEYRISPKDSVSNANNSARKILAIPKNLREKVLFAAHLIKRPEHGTRNRKGYINNKWHRVQKEYKQIIHINELTLNKSKELKNGFNGYDCANNELYVPPEAYLPVYALDKVQKWPFRIHIAEEFHHVLSGLRNIYEVYSWLDLRRARLGHCTALGIRIEKWQEDHGEYVYISKGEWLDNLIFLASIFKEEERADFHVRIRELFFEIYNLPLEHSFSTTHLIYSWNLRRLNFSVVDVSSPEYLRARFPKLSKMITVESIYFFKLHHRQIFWSRQNEVIKVSTKLYSDYITKVQNKIINDLNSRELCVEVMLSSNVRIGIYDQFKEHHLFRWILESRSNMGPIPNYVLCTDNTGTFSTDLRREYYLMMKCLCFDYNIPEDEAVSYLLKSMENSKRYLFKKVA